MSEKEYQYDYIADQLDEVIDRELDSTRTTITRAEIRSIVENVLWRCGVKIGGKDLRIKHEGYIDRYHRGLFVAVRDADREGVHLYPLKPGQCVDILTDRGEWETVRVEKNPAALDDPAALRVRLDVDDETPVIGAYARRSALLDMRARAEIEAAKKAEIKQIEGEVKKIEYPTHGNS